MDYLPKLLVECCPDSKIAEAVHCARTKAMDITALLSNKAREEIISVLKTNKFSMIVDETTNISTKKSLVVIVRYMDKL